jgi:lysophospholipase L1-like esterase
MPPPPLTANVTIHVVGDSTAAIFPASDPTARVGWAAVLAQFFGRGVTVDDAARSGRSSKSFLAEGHWAELKARIAPGDYVFIQFGHNDEKPDPARYTDPATTFRTNLKTYVSETREKGGFAVLLTPISRRKFEGSTVVPTHGAYPAAVAAVGKETGAPVIDMTEKTRLFLERLGPEATVPLFAVDDNTHLSAQGAPEVAQLAVQGIRELGLPLVQRLAP